MWTTNVTVFRAHERVTAVICFYPFPLSRFVQQRQENGQTSLDRRLGFFSTIKGIGNRFYKYQKHMFNRDHSVRTLLSKYVWLFRMSELSRFVYIVSHVTLHVKSNAEKVNCQL